MTDVSTGPWKMYASSVPVIDFVAGGERAWPSPGRA